MRWCGCFKTFHPPRGPRFIGFPLLSTVTQKKTCAQQSHMLRSLHLAGSSLDSKAKLLAMLMNTDWRWWWVDGCSSDMNILVFEHQHLDNSKSYLIHHQSNRKSNIFIFNDNSCFFLPLHVILGWMTNISWILFFSENASDNQDKHIHVHVQ